MTRTANSAAPASGPAPASPQDPWVLSQNGYDPDRIYTKATDGNGQSTVLHVKVSPALYYELQALVQSRAIPELRTYADVVRDALIHRMHHYRNMLPAGATSMFHALDVEVRQAEIDKVAADRAAWSKFIEDLDTRLEELVGTGEFDEAWWLLDQNEQVHSMSPAYVERLEQVREKWIGALNRVSPRLLVVPRTITPRPTAD